MLSSEQVADLAKAIKAIENDAPPIECRLHPDDWNRMRRLLPAASSRLAQVSLFADIGIESAIGSLTEIRIVIDVDAPRMPQKGSPA